MKKMLTTTCAVLTLTVIVLAQKQPRTPMSYDGPYDDTYWTGWNWSPYDSLSSYTSFGALARYSDIIGVGIVNNVANDHFTVTVDYALVGCTNGTSVVVWEDPNTLWNHYPSKKKADYLPTNDSRIVFAVYTNDYKGGGRFWWNSPTLEIPYPQPKVLTRHQLRYLNRSWWHVDRDDGVLFDHFTNVLQAVRVERNWTNFFYLCRDGANSPSNRVREDSFWDMRALAQLATDERAQFMLDDPLVDPVHTEGIFTGNWRAKPDP